VCCAVPNIIWTGSFHAVQFCHTRSFLFCTKSLTFHSFSSWQSCLLLLSMFQWLLHFCMMTHFPTVMDMCRHLRMDGDILKFTLGKDSGREVLNPVVVDPSTLKSPRNFLGSTTSMGKCIFMSVAQSSKSSQKCLEGSGKSGIDPLNALSQLVDSTVHAATSGKGTKRSSMIGCGFTDSSQHSHGEQFLHAFALPGQQNSSSLKLAHECSKKNIPKGAEGLSLVIGQGARSLLENHVCSTTPELKDLHSKNRAEFDQWTTAQRELKRKMHPNAKRPSGKAVGASSGVTASSPATGVHIDNNNASAEFGGPPDHHVCLTDNPSVGFLVCLAMPNNKLQPVLVVQREFATTCFCGGSSCHGSVHIGTCMSQFQHVCMMPNLHQEGNPSSDWQEPVNSHRVFHSSFTKSSFPMVCRTVRACKKRNEEIKLCKVKHHGGRDQVKNHRKDHTPKTTDSTCTLAHMLELQKNGRTIAEDLGN